MTRPRSFPICACAALVAAQAFAQEPLPEYSIVAPLAPKSLLLDAARAGARLVVAGERGIVLTSDDEGKTWKQAKVPTRATLTGVYFVDDKHGWVVGQDLTYIEVEGAQHNEESWAGRVEPVLKFLFPMG